MVTEITDLNDPRLKRYFTSFQDSAWCLETLPAYWHRTDTEAFARFADGDASLVEPMVRPWIEEILAPAVDSGRAVGRVRVIERTTSPEGKLDLGDALRFELEGYKHLKAAGEEIRIAWAEAGTWPKGVWRRGHDFWFFDDQTVIEMHHDEGGAFRVAVAHDDTSFAARARRCQKAAMAASRPFYP